MSHHRLTLVLLLFGLFTLMVGCSADVDSPEAQIRAMIDQAETAAEAREFNKLKYLIASDYSDNHGFDKKAAERLLRLYLFRHQSIHLVTRVRAIELPEPRQADVKLTIAVAGTPAPTDLSGWRAEVLDMELVLAKDDAEWKVVRASWKRGAISDLL